MTEQRTYPPGVPCWVDTEQPDLNWEHDDVWAEHEDVLRFWFDRGAAGVRECVRTDTNTWI